MQQTVHYTVTYTFGGSNGYFCLHTVKEKVVMCRIKNIDQFKGYDKIISSLKVVPVVKYDW